MLYRPLGRTGLTVSTIGFGAWGIGGGTDALPAYGPADDARSRRALRRAVDLGITLFDTSNLYGSGHSERLIGETLADVRDRVVIATKAGFTDQGEQDFSVAALRRSVEASLRRLNSDYVDLLQLHSPDLDALRAQPEVFALLDDLVREGKARAHGISVRAPADGLVALRDFGAAVLQVNLNMLDPRAVESGLTARAEADGAALIARTPLALGYLAGGIDIDTVFPPTDHRSRWPEARRRHWLDTSRRVLAAVSDAPPDQTPTQKALRYCLSQPAVATVLPGMLGAREVEENAQAGSLAPLQAADVARIHAIVAEAEAREKAEAEARAAP